MAPTPTSDRQCQVYATCIDTAYQIVTPTPTSDRKCALLTVCVANVSFEAVPPTLTSDRNCTACTVCARGYTAIANCTLVSNRQCADITPPVITLFGPPSFTVEAGPPYDDPGFSAFDEALGDITKDVTYIAPNTRLVGTYFITYLVSDGVNSATARRTVTVIDTEPPTITLLLGANFTMRVCNSSSNSSSNSTCPLFDPLTAIRVTDNTVSPVNISVTGTVNLTRIGTYVLVYHVVDAQGNAANDTTMTVTVVDPSMPVLRLIGPAEVTIEAGSTYRDAGVNVSDLEDSQEELRAHLNCTSNLNTSQPGTYQMECHLTDTSGKEAIPVTRTIIVVDTVAPTITVLGANPLQLEAGPYAFDDPGATAVDLVDGPVDVQRTSSVDMTVPGGYEVRYTAVDSSGNRATATRVVLVRKKEKEENVTWCALAMNVMRFF